jgi:hypothetical protein
MLGLASAPPLIVAYCSIRQRLLPLAPPKRHEFFIRGGAKGAAELLSLLPVGPKKAARAKDMARLAPHGWCFSVAASPAGDEKQGLLGIRDTEHQSPPSIRAPHRPA